MRTMRVPATVERGIQETLAAYTAGNDLAVERWMATSQGRSAFPYLELVMGRETSPWSRDKAAFLLEVVVAITVAPPGRDSLSIGFRGPSALQMGSTLMASRPTPVGANPEEDRFELLWFQTALGVAQGIQQYWVQQDLLDQIAARFRPATIRDLLGDTRIPLARGIAAAGMCCNDRSPGEVIQIVGPSERRRITATQAVALFEEAAAVPALRVEALIRGAVLLHKIGRHADALAWFERVPPHQDRALGYVHYLTYGRILDGANRAADAAAAYTSALQYEPMSQLAAIGQAAALLRAGRGEEAAVAATEARTLASERLLSFDTAYRRADARYVREWLAEIRKLRH